MYSNLVFLVKANNNVNNSYSYKRTKRKIQKQNTNFFQEKGFVEKYLKFHEVIF